MEQTLLIEALTRLAKLEKKDGAVEPVDRTAGGYILGAGIPGGAGRDEPLGAASAEGSRAQRNTGDGAVEGKGARSAAP